MTADVSSAKESVVLAITSADPECMKNFEARSVSAYKRRANRRVLRPPEWHLRQLALVLAVALKTKTNLRAKSSAVPNTKSHTTLKSRLRARRLENRELS